MKLIISHKIKKKESLDTQKQEILFSALKKGIFDEIKGENLPKNTKLIKFYITSQIGDRRAIFLVELNTETFFFLFFRDKKDKIGENITIKNEFFRTTLHKYLDILKTEIEIGNFEEFDI